LRSNNNIEFQYTEPKKLNEIEKFLIEYFISTCQNDNIFSDTEHELKYFNSNLITIIEEILVINKNTNILKIMALINKKIEDQFNQNGHFLNRMPTNPAANHTLNESKREKRDNYSMFLAIPKEFVFKVLYHKQSQYASKKFDTKLDQRKENFFNLSNNFDFEPYLNNYKINEELMVDIKESSKLIILILKLVKALLANLIQ